jgi:A/G-specific adenine glycosylase
MDEIGIGKNDRLRVFLLGWGKNNIENYPWRFVDDPFCILVSEFMLHRTQTRQVIPIYQNFIAHYPDLESFISADLSEIQSNLKSLGLQWRIDGMVKALKEIWFTYREVPLDIEKLLAIHGIGQYIAGATVCFSQNIPLPLVDSNIVRVIGRVFGLDLSGEARRRQTIIQAIHSAVDLTEPRNYYYAVIDLAHNICKPTKPECTDCPLLRVPCSYGQNKVLS